MEQSSDKYNPAQRVERESSKRLIRDSLIQGRRPRVSELRWPSRPVVFEMFAWLNSHPHVETWCRGSRGNCNVFIKFLAEVEKCYARKKRAKPKQSDDSDRELVNTDAIQASASNPPATLDVCANRRVWWRKKRRAWWAWPATSDRELARECFTQRSEQIIERLLQLREAASLLGELGFDAKGWDLSSAEKHIEDLTKVLEIAQKLRKSEELQKILRQLGRIEKCEDEDLHSQIAQVFESVFERQRVRRAVMQSGIPFETTGIELSDDLELMLPDEAVLLADPDFEDLWYARFAEGQLATYSVAGTEIEERIERRPKRRPKAVARTGPVVALIDTSASMQWGGAGMETPEAIAKAAVLGLCRVAFQQSRRVFVINFSGSTSISPHELTFDINGLLKLLEFLQNSFSGGTDINPPMRMALRKIESDDTWESADILVASDGEFGVDPDVITLSETAKRRDGLRITGLLIGDHSHAMRSLCGRHVHPFRDWMAVAPRRD